MLFCECTVVERAGGYDQCALLNETLFLPERGATLAKRRPPSVSLNDLTSTRLFWIVIMAALSGTCLVLLTVAVAVLMRRVCCYISISHRRRRHHQLQQQCSPHHLFTSRHRRMSCDCQQTSPVSQLPLADIEQLDELSQSARCHATEV